VKVKLLKSAFGADEGHQFLMSYLVDDCLAIDAGSLGLQSPLAVQAGIKYVFLSHSHIDHIASLPCFLDNVYRDGPDCPTIYASRETLESLRRDFFNDRVWPDLFRLSEGESQFLKTQELQPLATVKAGRYQVTPVPLDHVVPTFGFVVDDGTSAFAVISDTSPSDAIWKLLNATPRLKGCFLESSFPNSMEWLARESKHLIPRLFAAERQKLTRRVPIIAVHIKPPFYPEVVGELEALRDPLVEVGQPGREYMF
jgi:cAMP phosphodiesterase